MISRFTEKFSRTGRAIIAAFGDSVTEGYFESREGMHGIKDGEAVYTNVLGRMISAAFPDRRIDVVNAGKGGDTAYLALSRLYSDVVSRSPDLVIVCFGLNDVTGSLQKYIDSLSRIFMGVRETGADAVFMTPNMLNTAVTSPILTEVSAKLAEAQISGRMDEFMENAVSLAQKHGAYICDCYSIWKAMYKAGADINALLANRINHPSRMMHGLFAAELFKTIFAGD